MADKDIVITMRAARVNAGYTQSEAAKELGINRDTLFRYEKDNSAIPRNIIESMAQTYKIPANNIFFGLESEHIRILRGDTDGTG